MFFLIYSTSHKFLQRNVFTIAHKIGHYFFYHDHLNVDCEGNENTVIEKIADTFAQELLVPSVALRQVYDEMGFALVDKLKPHHVGALCEYFKVSFFMMLVCLRQTQKIDYDEYMELKGFCLNSLAVEAETSGYHPEKCFSNIKSLDDQLKKIDSYCIKKKTHQFF